MGDELLSLAAELRRRGEPFALATVVRCEAPTSAKPGAKALIRADGTVSGWVGGACSEPVVVREALNALRDGRPRLIGLYGEGGRGPGRTEGMLEYTMTCHSGGTLEIYVEPYLPKPLLVLVGHGPVVETLASLGHAADYSIAALREDAIRVGLDEHRQAAARVTEVKDPICGMLVEVGTAGYRSEVSGQLVYFCCHSCKETFDRDPARHLAGLGG